MSFTIKITHQYHYLKGDRLILDPEEKIETWGIANVRLTGAWDDAMRTARSMLEDGYAVTAISVTPCDENA